MHKRPGTTAISTTASSTPKVTTTTTKTSSTTTATTSSTTTTAATTSTTTTSADVVGIDVEDDDVAENFRTANFFPDDVTRSSVGHPGFMIEMTTEKFQPDSNPGQDLSRHPFNLSSVSQHSETEKAFNLDGHESSVPVKIVVL